MFGFGSRAPPRNAAKMPRFAASCVYNSGQQWCCVFPGGCSPYLLSYCPSPPLPPQNTMSSGDPLPYNVTLTDQSAIIRFFPHRDGAVDDNWNTTYSDSSFAEWSYDDTFGKGVSYISFGRAALIWPIRNLLSSGQFAQNDVGWRIYYHRLGRNSRVHLWQWFKEFL